MKPLNQNKMKTAVELLYDFLYEMEDINGFDAGDFNQEKVFKCAV